MKITMLFALAVLLIGCKEKTHSMDSSSRVIPLESVETITINVLKTDENNNRIAYEKASEKYGNYQYTIFNKYARKNEQLELSEDGKYVIARPSNYYYYIQTTTR